MNYKVLITTSGTGSRLGELTKDLNKALVKVGGKETISHIIDYYPKEVPIVVTLGYLAEQVKTFLGTNHSDRIFEFVYIDPYEGEGSSLGYSMLQAKSNLQGPFIFHACDTLVFDEIPAPDKNFIVGLVVDKETTDLEWTQYRTHKVEDGKVIGLKEKGDPDFESIHIGISGIKDYEKFWETLEALYESDKETSNWSDVHVVDTMIKDGTPFEWIPFSVWLDTGTPKALEMTEEYLKEHKK